jgi:hypothetical protein
MQDSNAATTATGAGASSARRELGTDRTTTTRVSSSAGVITTPHTPPSFPAWSRAAKASAFAKGGLSPTTLFFSSSSQTPDARLRDAIATPPKFRSPGLHLELLRDPFWKSRIHFYLFPIIVLAHVPLPTFLDFNAICIFSEWLVLLCCFLLN